MFMNLFKPDHLPDLDPTAKKELDCAQYDAHEIEGEDVDADAASQQILRKDDGATFKQNWQILKRMMRDNEYKEEVYKKIMKDEK